jgi:hypothetical protein
MIYHSLLELYSNDFVYDPSFASFFMDNTLIEVRVGDRIDHDLLVKIRTVLFESEETFNINVENVLSEEYSYRLQFLYTHDSVCCIVIKNQLKVDSIVFQFVFNVCEMFSVDSDDFEVLVNRIIEPFVINDEVCKTCEVGTIISHLKARGILVMLNGDYETARVFNDFYL